MSLSQRLGFHEQLADAACAGDSTRVLRLIARGADPNYQDSVGQFIFYTPLMWAVTHGHKEAAQVLLQAGADVNRTTSTGDSALMIAAANGDIAMVRWLLEVGADRAHKDIDGNDALAYATHNKHEEVAKVLKERA